MAVFPVGRLFPASISRNSRQRGILDTKIRVLIADDIADLRAMVRIALETDGRFRVVGEAGNGIEAIELAGSLEPDIVVLDISMPHMDGLTAIPEIHRHSPKSRILVLSGYDDRAGERAIAAGADDYMPKTAHIKNLPTKLLGVLGGKTQTFRGNDR